MEKGGMKMGWRESVVSLEFTKDNHNKVLPNDFKAGCMKAEARKVRPLAFELGKAKRDW